MRTLVDHARALIAYSAWADDRILATADGISDEQYGQIRGQLGHMLGTYRWWYANWTGGTADEPHLDALAVATTEYASTHRVLTAYGQALTQDEWERAEQWWLPWGHEARMALGESITQLFYHGVQHRSEIAVALSLWGRSPGDLDYLTYLSEMSGLS